MLCDAYVLQLLHFVTSTLCAATFSNSYVKRHLRYVMLHFVAVPSAQILLKIFLREELKARPIEPTSFLFGLYLERWKLFYQVLNIIQVDHLIRHGWFLREKKYRKRSAGNLRKEDIWLKKGRKKPNWYWFHLLICFGYGNMGGARGYCGILYVCMYVHVYETFHKFVILSCICCTAIRYKTCRKRLILL